MCAPKRSSVAEVGTAHIAAPSRASRTLSAASALSRSACSPGSSEICTACSTSSIRTVCEAVGKPVNVLARANLTFAELAAKAGPLEAELVIMRRPIAGG